MRRAVELGVVSAYAAAGALAAGFAVVLGHDPIRTESWFGLEGWSSVAWSLLMGALLAGAAILSSRVLARRTEWARALHVALRPSVRDVDGVTIAWMALSSGIGEELLFRGLLVPLVGVWVSSIGFGLLHQVRGPARWVWAVWACAMGIAFALVFCVTGSLAGAVLAHVAVNGANLRYIRDVDPARRGDEPDLPYERDARFTRSPLPPRSTTPHRVRAS